MRAHSDKRNHFGLWAGKYKKNREEMNISRQVSKHISRRLLNIDPHTHTQRQIKSLNKTTTTDKTTISTTKQFLFLQITFSMLSAPNQRQPFLVHFKCAKCLYIWIDMWCLHVCLYFIINSSRACGRRNGKANKKRKEIDNSKHYNMIFMISNELIFRQWW